MKAKEALNAQKSRLAAEVKRLRKKAMDAKANHIIFYQAKVNLEKEKQLLTEKKENEILGSLAVVKKENEGMEVKVNPWKWNPRLLLMRFSN